MILVKQITFVAGKRRDGKEMGRAIWETHYQKLICDASLRSDMKLVTCFLFTRYLFRNFYYKKI